jgi:hypothetical protein
MLYLIIYERRRHVSRSVVRTSTDNQVRPSGSRQRENGVLACALPTPWPPAAHDTSEDGIVEHTLASSTWSSRYGAIFKPFDVMELS